MLSILSACIAPGTPHTRPWTPVIRLKTLRWRLTFTLQRVQGLNLTATHRTEQPSNAEFNVVRNKFAPALPHGHRVLLHLGVDVQLAQVAELLALAVGARVPQQSDLAEGGPS